MNGKIIIAILLLSIIGAVLRFWGITTNPVSLSIDEVAIGYDAYAIWMTGKDQHGISFPLSFRSIGDYKAPVLVYMTAPSVGIIGLNELGVRMPVFLSGVAGIAGIYLLTYQVFKRKDVGLMAAILTTFSLWHIYYSRYGVEGQVALLILIAGILSLLRLFEGGKMWIIISAVILALGMYSYHAFKLFIPIFVLIIFLLNFSWVLKNKAKLLIFCFVFGVLAMPLLVNTVFGPDKTRAQMVFITHDIEFTRPVAVKADFSGGFFPESINRILGNEIFLLIFHWVRKYLYYFHPGYLFSEGMHLTQEGIYGLGIYYLFELPFIIFGIYRLFRFNYRIWGLVVAWILVGIFPASLTNNEQHTYRTFVAYPGFVFVSALGAAEIYRRIRNLKGLLKYSISFVMAGVIVFFLVEGFLLYAFHFPKQRGDDLMEGSKEAVIFALENQDAYDEIVFDPYRESYIVSVPHMYVLFYSKYDPTIYQNIEKISGEENFKFDKYVFKSVDWVRDSQIKNRLIIVSPWRLNKEVLESDRVVRKIYNSNKRLVFVVLESDREEGFQDEER